jgi:iodotyrosine deiodinase
VDREVAYRALFPDLPRPAYEPLAFRRRPPHEMLRRAQDWYAELDRRRTTREFSDDPVPRELIELAVLSGSTAPSGAHKQPWTFVAVDDPELKRELRAAAEEEEFETYTKRMSDDWRVALAPLGTDWVKAHLTDAPWLVVLFKQRYELRPDGTRRKNFYVAESVGIAAGLFISAIHLMGLAALTHTPSPMGFLRELLLRPKNEAAVMLFAVGYPADGARVPKLRRKPLQAVVQWNRGEHT